MENNVDHPQHYNQGEIECIDCLKAATINKPPFEAVCVSNVIKYLWRYESKNGLEDVQKAAWYINRLMQELAEKSNKYQLVGTENGVGLQTPWHTLMVPHEGDMFNPKDAAREHLLQALLQGGGYCPCQPQKDRDTMCPCKNYRVDNKCICGLFVKVPQSVVSEESDENQVVGNESDTEKGTE
jgi:ferredoxin-thioredoxin reductase catalytic subunit